LAKQELEQVAVVIQQSEDALAHMRSQKDDILAFIRLHDHYSGSADPAAPSKKITT